MVLADGRSPRTQSRRAITEMPYLGVQVALPHSLSPQPKGGHGMGSPVEGGRMAR